MEFDGITPLLLDHWWWVSHSFWDTQWSNKKRGDELQIQRVDQGTDADAKVRQVPNSVESSCFAYLACWRTRRCYRRESMGKHLKYLEISWNLACRYLGESSRQQVRSVNNEWLVIGVCVEGNSRPARRHGMDDGGAAYWGWRWPQEYPFSWKLWGGH